LILPLLGLPWSDLAEVSVALFYAHRYHGLTKVVRSAPRAVVSMHRVPTAAVGSVMVEVLKPKLPPRTTASI